MYLHVVYVGNLKKVAYLVEKRSDEKETKGKFN